MQLVKIMEIIENIESKLQSLSEARLELLETILKEGSEFEFDVEYHINYLVEFVKSQTNNNARILTETINGGEILKIILESVRKNTNDLDTFISEVNDQINNISIDNFDDETETRSVPLLSIVANTLTEILDEETVENLPAEMVFDLAEEAKYLDLSDEAIDMDISSLVEEISSKLKKAIHNDEINLDTNDYQGETLAEFLSDYSDINDLLEEMNQVNDEILAEVQDKAAAELMRKAKAATVLVEEKMKRCKAGDMKCKQEKAAAAKEYFKKHDLPGGGNAKNFSMNKISGKLAKHVKKAIKASKEATGKPLSKEYIQYVLVPGIIKRMRIKNKKLKAKDMKKKVGMR